MAVKVHPLDSWQSLQESINDLDEKTLEKLMAEELTGKKRRHMVMRIHSKINRLRADRERQELFKKTVLARSGKAN